MAPNRESSTVASCSLRGSSWRGNHYGYTTYQNQYDTHVPVLMEPQNDTCLVRSSLLAFRPSRMLRVTQQQHQNEVYKQQLQHARECSRDTTSENRSTAETVRVSDTSDDTDSYPSSEVSSDNNDTTTTIRSSRVSSGDQSYRDIRHVSTVEEDQVNDNVLKQKLHRSESLIPIMAMPVSGPIPLLERMESDEENNEIDTIICDPTKLPRTLIVDEDGFTLSRESVMARAANVPRGGIIKSGLLFKQGFGLRAGGWKVRFVVLTSTKMTFFREERGRKRGEIDLAKCSAKCIEIMPRDSVFDGSQATMWRFAIRVKNRRVLLSAYTESEMKDWLRCLHVALAAQGSGFGRFTDFVVPSGTFLASRSGGLLRSSGNL